jgi:hypothetical protein
MNLPSEWNQLTRQQFIRIAAILFSGCDAFEGKIKLLWLASGLKAKKFTRYDIEELAVLVQRIEWISELFIQKSFFPQIFHRFRYYKGMEDTLQNFTFDQFFTADNYFSQFMQHRNEADLDAFISCVFVRKEFDFETHDKHLHRFSSLPIETKTAILINFTGMRAVMADMYPGCFNKSKNDSGVRSVLHPMEKLKDDLAGAKFGTINEVGRTRIHAIFTHLQNNEEKRWEMEKQQS